MRLDELGLSEARQLLDKVVVPARAAARAGRLRRQAHRQRGSPRRTVGAPTDGRDSRSRDHPAWPGYPGNFGRRNQAAQKWRAGNANETRAPKFCDGHLRGGNLVWELSRLDLILSTLGKYLRQLVTGRHTYQMSNNDFIV
jgi:hypothetical protein